jgi:hypothetical protein
MNLSFVPMGKASEADNDGRASTDTLAGTADAR